MNCRICHLKFVAGVNGDYAHPTIYYDAFYNSEFQVSYESQTTIHFTDYINEDKEAESTITLNVSFPKANNFVVGDESDVLLRGFDLQMACLDVVRKSIELISNIFCY